MQYKSMVLDLLQEDPELYERLRSSKRLLPTMDEYATELKARHESTRQRLRGWMKKNRPGSGPTETAQIDSLALEIAVSLLRRAHLPSVSATADEEPLSLDQAIDYIRHRTPPA